LQDLKTLKVTAWWKKAQDRDIWKAVAPDKKKKDIIQMHNNSVCYFKNFTACLELE
jgi:hypothetical protein